MMNKLLQNFNVAGTSLFFHILVVRRRPGACLVVVGARDRTRTGWSGPARRSTFGRASGARLLH
jgi:hypothetical protein